jgi:hypothetical protein
MPTIKVIYYNKKEVSQNEILLDIQSLENDLLVETDKMTFQPYIREELTEEEFKEELDARGGAEEYIKSYDLDQMVEEALDEAFDDMTSYDLAEKVEEKFRYDETNLINHFTEMFYKKGYILTKKE